jgi:hypothetical protein
MNAPLIALSVVLAGVPEDGGKAAKEKLKPFKVALKEALTHALEKSPITAIDVCSKDAPELAKQFSSPSVKVGRAAFKLRNEKNVAPSWVTEPMERLSKEKPGTEASRLVDLKDGRYGYVEAIWVQPMCLTCHGTAIDPAVSSALKAKYPKDAATGFSEGDFRGVFWAELPRSP